MEQPARAITLVLADDHNVMRSGLRMLLEAEPDFEVLAEAADVPGGFRNVRRHRPDVLVLDLNMPGGSSIDAIRRLGTISPVTAVVVLTSEEDRAFVHEALDAGATGYVQKQAAGRKVVRAIRDAVTARPRPEPSWARPPRLGHEF
jgi:two-component system response regulator NreC